MTKATLAEVLAPALAEGFAVPGFVVLGFEDAKAYVAAAEKAQTAVILQAGPGFRRHMPLAAIGAMFSALADAA